MQARDLLSTALTYFQNKQASSVATKDAPLVLRATAPTPIDATIYDLRSTIPLFA